MLFNFIFYFFIRELKMCFLSFFRFYYFVDILDFNILIIKKMLLGLMILFLGRSYR